jgi:hypothetical protein
MGRRRQPFGVSNLVRVWVGEKTSPIQESKLELVVVIAINVVLWAMVVVEIWGVVRFTAPLIPIGYYPVA